MNWLPAWKGLDAAGFAAFRLLASAAWQSALLVSGAGVLALVLRRRKAGVRHRLWLSAVLVAPLLPAAAAGLGGLGVAQRRLAVLPAYSAPVSVSEWTEPGAAPPAGAARTPGSRPAAGTGSTEPAERAGRSQPTGPGGPRDPYRYGAPPARPGPWSHPWALGLLAYGAVVLACLACIAGGRLCLHSWIRKAHLVTDRRVLAAFREARERVGLDREVVVLQTDRIHAPVSVGVMRSLVLLPAGLVETLGREELRGIAAHEVAHAARRDPLWLAAVSVVRALLFFHPLIWVAGRNVRGLAEAACDESAVELTRRPLAYARMLARLAEVLPRRVCSAQVTAGFVLTRNAFLARIEGILSRRTVEPRGLSWPTQAAVLLALVFFVGLASAVPLGESTPPPAEAPGPLRLALEKWISTCPVGWGGITISPDSRRLYVASSGVQAAGAPVEEYDIRTGRRLRVFPFGLYHCHGDAVLSRSGRFLYTTNYYYTHASRLDLRYGGREKRVEVGGVRTAVWASRIGITPDRRLLVVALGQDSRPADLENDQVSLLAVDQGRFSLVAQVGLPDEPRGRLTGITADSRWLYLPTYPRRSAEATLYEIRLADPVGVTRRLALPGSRLEDAAVHEESGKVFVSDRRQKRVWVIDRRTFKVRSKIDLAGTAPGPLRLWRRAGILFAVSPEAGILWAIDPAAERPLARLGGLGEGLLDLEISPDGKRVFTALGGKEGGVCVVRILRKPADP